MLFGMISTLLGFGIASASTTAKVDRVENSMAHVVFALENSSSVSTDIPVALLPCTVREGDTLYINKRDGTTTIRCTEQPPPPTVEVRINPETGAIEYSIQGLEITQQQNQ